MMFPDAQVARMPRVQQHARRCKALPHCSTSCVCVCARARVCMCVWCCGEATLVWCCTSAMSEARLSRPS